MTVGLDLDRLRRELESERTRLAAAIQSVNHPQSLADETGDLSIGTDDHLADTATETYMRELDDGLEENVERLLAEVEAALARIDQGTYGTCLACGRPIDADRLEAVPYATLCLEDKRVEEGAR
jgi:RNA polymerase-binding transcription factor DksA